MRKIYLLLVTCYLLLVTPALTLAISPTPGEETATPTGRLEQIKERVQERIQDLTKAKKRAVWGTLSQVTNSTLVLTTSRGEQRIKTTDQTKFFIGKKEGKMSDLAIGNFIIAMGYEENGVFVARRVSASSQPPKPAPRRNAVYGKVSDISEEEKILVLTHPKKPELSFEVKITDKTVITKKVDGKMQKIKFEEIKIGDRVVAVGTQEKEGGTITAKLIHVIPGKATGLEKELTPTPKASPTSKPKAKATPTPAE